ncbi:MAG: hypothetical protein Q8P20_09945 [bacterium]|nr:hypothetical protein [bacterium]
MAFIFIDRNYAPVGFLIVRDEGDPYVESETVLIDVDWNFPRIAQAMGWRPCDCGQTDGTVPCEKCNKCVHQMIAEAHDFIEDNVGKTFHTLDAFLIGSGKDV